MKKIISLLLVLFVACGCAIDSKKEDKIVLEEKFEYVFDAGTFTSLDYEFAEAYYEKEYDNWYAGGCSAIAKTLDNGDTIVGRNMDLNISNKAAYIFRTDVEGCYKTINLAYTFRKISPDYEDAKANGLPDDFSKVLPFMADDVLNEEGLYVEINMRNGEVWPTGKAKFSCSGTNPESDHRVYMFELPRLIGEHCATVDEAIDYVKSLDIYSMDNYWTYCFLLADKTGHYGLLELAADQVLFADYQPAQTNFYVDPTMNELEELKCGVGRYELLMNNIDSVNSEDDMFKLMDRVTYYDVYDPYNCEYDIRSEDVGVTYFATYDILMMEENKEFIYDAANKYGEYVRSLTRAQQQFQNEFWESSFTEVINCNERTLFVRFFEDNNKTIKLSFED